MSSYVIVMLLLLYWLITKMPANLIIGFGRKGTPSREHPGGSSQASKAIENFDIISTGAQRQALQRYGRIVEQYRSARRDVEVADLKLDRITQALSEDDSADGGARLSRMMDNLQRARDAASRTMYRLEKDYRKARKYLDTEMTDAPMSTINEGNEPDPLAAAEQD